MAIRYTKNENGPVLGWSDASGIKILEVDGLSFKNLSKTGQLQPYEDWRLSPEERVKDLVGRFTPEQLVASCFLGRGLGGVSWEMTPENLKALADDPYRSMGRYEIFDMFMEDLNKILSYVNDEQEVCEALPYGIPMMYSMEGVGHIVGGSKRGLSKNCSDFPSTLGIGATFDPKYAGALAGVEAKEYRSMGMTLALTPQIDLATEPRWSRCDGTYGEGSKLGVDMARSYVDAIQTSTGDAEIRDGWGYESVAGTAKHWPGGGSGEGGRDAHYQQGKYAVYPGGNFEEHMAAFTEGAFKLDGPTKEAACLMPYYTISYGADDVYGENVGNGYSKYILTDLLRDRFGYKGMVTTDFGIMRETFNGPGGIPITGSITAFGGGRCWGCEHYSTAARYLKTFEAGIDQYGGGDDYEGLLEGYRLGVEKYGEEYMLGILREKVERIMILPFKLGLFENPYVTEEKARKTLRCEEHMALGEDCQRKSLILLKNHENVLPIREKKKVYIPMRHREASGFFLNLNLAVMEKGNQASDTYPINLDTVAQFYDFTDSPDEADFAMVLIESPSTGNGIDQKDREAGGNGYKPISLQYRPYTAANARETSLAGGHITEPFTNRSYRGKTVTASNECDLDVVLDTRKKMGDKPVIVLMEYKSSVVVKEFEGAADAIVAYSGASDKVLLELVSGAFEPSGLLPMQFPADMETVEAQREDVPFDMECHVDVDGNTYDYGFGLNWNGPISDWRTEKYGKAAYGK